MPQEQQTQTHFFSEYTDNLKAHLEKRFLLLRLNLVKITSNLISKILVFTIVAVFGFFVFLFLNVMLAFYLSSVLDNYYYGFGIVGGIYLLLLLICIIFRKALLGNFIMNNMLDAVFEKTEKIDTDGL